MRIMSGLKLNVIKDTEPQMSLLRKSLGVWYCECGDVFVLVEIDFAMLHDHISCIVISIIDLASI